VSIKPALPDVALVAIDAVAHELSGLAIEACTSRVFFGDVLQFSDTPLNDETYGTWIPTPPLRSWADINRVWWYEVPKHPRPAIPG
jgi:hypothetical protein